MQELRKQISDLQTQLNAPQISEDQREQTRALADARETELSNLKEQLRESNRRLQDLEMSAMETSPPGFARMDNLGLYIILFLVGLQGIPQYLYEAAEMDGAKSYQRFFHITIPSLNNTMLLVIILSTIGGFSLFIEPFVMTGGGPMNSTLSAMLYIYNQAFYFGHMGYAATLGFFFAFVILIVILIQKKVVERE